MNTNEPTILNINAFPTPKEQVVSGLIGLGLTVVTVAVGYGILLGVGYVAQKVEARKAQKTPIETDAPVDPAE